MLLAKSEPFLLAFLRTAEVFAILVGGVFCGEEVSLAKSSQIDCPSFCLSGHPLILLLLLTTAARLVFNPSGCFLLIFLDDVAIIKEEK